MLSLDFNYLSALDESLSLLRALPKITLYPIVAFVLLLLYHTCRRKSLVNLSNSQKVYLQALSTVVIPTRNARGMALVPHTITMRKQTIILPLTPLLDKICSGDIELRTCAVDDLADLFQDRLRVYGWNIVLDVEPWRRKVICWLFKVHFFYHKVRTCVASLSIVY